MRAEQALTYFKRRRDAMQLMEEDIAIWALEKQIPKKPITETVNRGISVSGEYDIDFNYLCPICNTVVGDDETDDAFYKFCPQCGQALDWGKKPINIYLQDLTSLMNRHGDNNEKKENENE